MANSLKLPIAYLIANNQLVTNLTVKCHVTGYVLMSNICVEVH